MHRNAKKREKKVKPEIIYYFINFYNGIRDYELSSNWFTPGSRKLFTTDLFTESFA